MFSKPNNFRDSVRRGAGFKSSNPKPANGPSFYGNHKSTSYSQSRPVFQNSRPRFQNKGGYGRSRKESNFDPNMFVKKANPIKESVEITPHNNFTDFPIATPLKLNLANKGYLVPTPIQDQAIMPMLEGKDVIGLANTGTGKTAAFLIPILDKIFKTRNDKALIVAPTRELAYQINEEVRSLTKDMHIYSTLVTGGASMSRQVYEIRRNPHIIIATPGRLKDLIERNILYLEDFSMFVLDEVDLMVDIGFIADIKYFINLLPKVRQSLFFSATINPKVNQILQTFVKDPITISVKQQDTAENVEQDVIKVIDQSKKLDQLHDLLIKDGFDKVMIFGRTKHGVEKLNKELTFRGFKVGAIHGNKSQGNRQRVLQSFKRNEIQILLATDVASRGLDIDNVTHVINYELPETFDDYIHRIGRTGRAGKTGMALTFVN